MAIAKIELGLDYLGHCRYRQTVAENTDMLVELLTTPRSRIETARYWGDISHLERPFGYGGPRDIIVAGDLAALRAALDAAGIDHTARTRMCVTPRDFRVDKLVLGARITARRVGDVVRMVEIAADLGVLVVDDAETGSPQGG